MQFSGKYCHNNGLAPPCGWLASPPPHGKSWIRHCVVTDNAKTIHYRTLRIGRTTFSLNLFDIVISSGISRSSTIVTKDSERSLYKTFPVNWNVIDFSIGIKNRHTYLSIASFFVNFVCLFPQLQRVLCNLFTGQVGCHDKNSIFTLNSFALAISQSSLERDTWYFFSYIIIQSISVYLLCSLYLTIRSFIMTESLASMLFALVFFIPHQTTATW